MFNILSRLLLLILFQSVVESATCARDGSSASYTEEIKNKPREQYHKKIRIIRSSGCPNHPHPPVESGFVATDQGKVVKIPAIPCYSTKDPVTFGQHGIGAIGILFNGVSVFTWTANDFSDAVQEESIYFDGCAGHASRQGDYHHHMSALCLLDQINDLSTPRASNDHSPQIGWAVDGFPIYGPHRTDGDLTYPCSTYPSSPECLDSCNGHVHDLGDTKGELYHYHITGPIAGYDMGAGSADDHPNPEPDVSMWPYTLGCLKGVPFRWSIIHENGNTAVCDVSNPAVTSDYSIQVADGITDPYIPDVWISQKEIGDECTWNAECVSQCCGQSSDICVTSCSNPVMANDKESLTIQHDVMEMDESNHSNELWMIPVFVFSAIGLLIIIIMCVICAVFIRYKKIKYLKFIKQSEQSEKSEQFGDVTITTDNVILVAEENVTMTSNNDVEL